MPTIVHGNLDDNHRDIEDLAKINYDYIYPNGLDLRPGTEFHKFIVDKVLYRARESAKNMSVRFSSWRVIDQTMTAYIDLSDSEEALKDKDKRKPVSIIYPHSYALMETTLGYLLSAYMQDPIFRYEGVSPEDTLGAILLEKDIDLQCYKSKSILNFHTMFRDALCYGFGAVNTGWNVQRGWQIEKQVKNRLFGSPQVSKVKRRKIVYEGNKLTNIDPYLALPDPNCPLGNAQNGEFFGWLEKSNYQNLLEEELDNPNMFNVKYLKHVKNRQSSIYADDNSGRHDKTQSAPSQRNDTALNPVDSVILFVKLIPKDWKLGSSEYPQLWRFRISCDSVVTEAFQLKLIHNQIPIGLCAPEFDGYSITPISRMEVLYGLQHTLDWLFNAHIANVRKAVNNTLIVDPYLINVPDVEKSREGGIIRTRRPAWGRGVANAVEQLKIVDITRSHMADSAIIKEAMDKVVGADGALMGSLRQGGPERLTGAEFKGTRQGSFNRLERIARIIGIQAFQDIGYQMAANTQQFKSQETFVKTTGRWQQTLMEEFGVKDKFMKVSPYDILINYDLKIRDGSIPGGNYSDVWTKLFEVVAGSQVLSQKFDIVRIFSHIARANGAKNVHDFIKTMPDNQVENQVQQGNLIPVPSQGGA